MDSLKGIKWNFDYNGKHYVNTLRDMGDHGDFIFEQNENKLRMDQIGERYFLPLLIYGMQKIKSPQEAKNDLENKNYIKGNGFNVSNSNGGAYWYFQPIFIILDEDKEFDIKNNYERNLLIKIDDTLKTLRDMKEEIILPYEQLSKTIDKLIICSQEGFFRTPHEDLSMMLDYYVSGEFEIYHKNLLSKMH